MKIKKLSIIVPAYNEAATIAKTLRRVLKIKIKGIKTEIVIVDDGSKDKTLAAIKNIKNKRISLISKRKNEGKGAAIKSALKKVTGDVITIQDADLEYNPDEIKKMIAPIVNGDADVVYGSRFIGSEPHRVLLFWHMIGNKILTLFCNMVTNLNLTDMETCYKMFTKDVAKKLIIKEDRFGFEPEFTIKIAKLKARVYEIGIGYSGRSYAEGKKINWKDGLQAVWCIIKYGILK
ncbi:MAG TPA: glycosyltransferase family 2 protein [Patescibacteria group bacterium]|nr:glycosyltransferase family 2 protein [Patescibacteria group bacterium]